MVFGRTGVLQDSGRTVTINPDISYNFKHLEKRVKFFQESYIHLQRIKPPPGTTHDPDAVPPNLSNKTVPLIIYFTLQFKTYALSTPDFYD